MSDGGLPRALTTEVGCIDALLERVLAEDLHGGDLTTRLVVKESRRVRAEVICRQRAVVCGGPVAARVFALVDPELRVEQEVPDGATVESGIRVLQIEGAARAILAAERTALNLLQRMSAVASSTRHYVDAAAGRCRITDTRKTMPGLRALDRYAVRCGGGHNHRNDLSTGILIKENHLQGAVGVAAAIMAAREGAPHVVRVACEVTDLDEFQQALGAGADIILLDNMDDRSIRQAVKTAAGKAQVEVSGGVTVDRVARLAELGVDAISVGAITHSAAAVDFSLLLVRDERLALV